MPSMLPPSDLQSRRVRLGRGAVAIGLVGAALGFGYWVGGRPQRRPRQVDPHLRKPDCSNVGPAGGELDGIQYLERLTPGADPSAPLPMVIVFHALGATASGYASFGNNLSRPARVIIPQGIESFGRGRSWKIRVGRPDPDLWVEVANQLSHFVADIALCRPTVGKPVLTGSSQGGHVSYLLASTHPYLVRGAVAVSGWLPPELWNPRMAPTVGIHGTDDRQVSYAETLAFAREMMERGAPMSFLSFPAAHQISTPMRRSWLESVDRFIG